MDAPGDERGGPQARVQAQLSVRHGRAAVEFYQTAFGAIERYRVGGTDAHRARGGSALGWRLLVLGRRRVPAHANFSPPSLGGGTVRMLLISADPRALIERAVAAGAREVYPAAEAHGWLLGRIEDPFGHHWESGRPLAAWPPAH